MTVQGGVIVYGIDEEPSGTRLTEATPMPLAGARERLDQITQTAIAEPPQLSITTLEEPNQPGEGYVIVAIPASPRAPHQIVAKGQPRAVVVYVESRRIARRCRDRLVDSRADASPQAA